MTSGFHTVKVMPSGDQETMASVAGSLTSENVFHRKGDTFMLSSELEPSASAAGGAAAAAAPPTAPAPRGIQPAALARRGGPERAVGNDLGARTGVVTRVVPSYDKKAAPV